MQIFATTLNGRKLTLEVEGHLTVFELTAMIKEQEGVDTQQLIVGVPKVVQQEMQSIRTLASYGIQKEADIRVVERGQTRNGDGDGTIARSNKARQRVDRMFSGLRDRWEKLEEERFALAERKASIAAQSSGKKLKKKVRMNVGGTLFTVLRVTLTCKPRSRLAALASGIYDGVLLRDTKGHIFLDLNPECFREVVDWLTAGAPSAPDGTPKQLVAPPGYEDTMKCMVDFLRLGAQQQPVEEGDPPLDECTESAPEPEPALEEGGGEESWKHYAVEEAFAGMLDAMQAERAALQAAIEEQQELVAEFEDEQQWIRYFAKATDEPTAPEVVALDLQGTTVTVKRSTLRMCPESVLAQRFSAETWAQRQGAEDSEDSEDDEYAGELIQESAYCMCKIIDQLRLRAMAGGAPPPCPSILQEKHDAFHTVLTHYFGGVENFILSVPKPVLTGYADAEPTYQKGKAIEPNQPQGELAIGEDELYFEATGLPAGIEIDPQTGVLSGTPTEMCSGASTEVAATNVAGRTCTRLRINVSAGGPRFVGFAHFVQRSQPVAEQYRLMDQAAARAFPGARAATYAEYSLKKIVGLPPTNTCKQAGADGILCFTGPGAQHNDTGLKYVPTGDPLDGTVANRNATTSEKRGLMCVME